MCVSICQVQPRENYACMGYIFLIDVYMHPNTIKGPKINTVSAISTAIVVMAQKPPFLLGLGTGLSERDTQGYC